MREVRLLPVVIAATCALLLLKGLGIMSGGGYVLTGPSPVEAAGEAEEAAEPEAVPETTLALPAEPTMADTAPVLDDGAPTLPLQAEAAAEAGEAAEHAGEGEPTEVAEAADGDEVAAEGAGVECPPITDQAEGLDFINEREECVAAEAVEAESAQETAEEAGEEAARAEVADAVPLIKDDEGNMVPLASPTGTPLSETAILERLAERRTALETLETELDMRMALVEAAEKRIEERTAALEALEARINAMVDEKRVLEEAQFVAVVSMYETMKPKDAAAIFDQLEMSVLLRVARAMNPRKMAPIMAKMNPSRAQELTAGMAVDQVEPTIALAGEDLGALPQIVGE